MNENESVLRRTMSLATLLAFLAVPAVLAGCTVGSSTTKPGASGPAATASSGASGSDGGANPGSGPTDGSVASACTDGGPSTVVDGWSRAVREDDLALEKDGIKVELHYALELTDALRAGGDVPANVWDALLGSRYRVKSRTTSTSSSTPIAVGDAVDLATSQAVFVAVAPTSENGVARPVVVVAPSRAAYQSAFPSDDAVAAMHRYNALPLSCAGLAGAWSSSFSSAAATYAASGAFTGITVSSAGVELGLQDGAKYTMHTKAFANGASETTDDAGTFVAEDYGLTLTGKSGATEYDAAFVAVKGGVALFVENRAFSGDRWVLYRK